MSRVGEGYKNNKGRLLGSLYCYKFGDDLLSHLIGSTIGADGLNFSVRNGKRWTPSLKSP